MEDHIRHAEGFAVVESPSRALDLGSGGGLPGLVLADRWPASSWLLLDANDRRAAALEQAVAELGWGDRVTIGRARAEGAAHDPSFRGQFDLVVARSFGSPAVTAECAAGFLRTGGNLLVSEPPEEDEARWPSAALAALGLADEGRHGTVRILRQVAAAPPNRPRREGVPAKRPLW